MEICVQKFGGSSLVSIQLRMQVVERVINSINAGCKPVIVVSAMGRNGDAYATDTLIALVNKVNSNPCLRNMDLLLNCGEIISSVVLAETLNKHKLTAVALTGWQCGVNTNQNYGNARIEYIDTGVIEQLLKEDKIPVVAGFQGYHNSSKEVTTLGRGGSDTTAVAIAAALGCKSCEIYTDVDGVKTADPCLVPNAPTLSSITYREVIELAHLGAKVIHPRAVEIAMEAGIELRIFAVNRSGVGTVISKSPVTKDGKKISDRVVTGIAHLNSRAHVRVTGAEDFNRTDLTLDIFEKLADQNISLDFIYVSPDLIAFIIDDQMSELVKEVLAGLKLNITVDQGYAKVSVVGAGMHGVPGVMARVIRSLEKAGVPIYQTTDSHANISCLIKEKNLVVAVRALFDEFELCEEEG